SRGRRGTRAPGNPPAHRRVHVAGPGPGARGTGDDHGAHQHLPRHRRSISRAYRCTAHCRLVAHLARCHGGGMGTLTAALTPTAPALAAAIRDAVPAGAPDAVAAPAVAAVLGRFVTAPDLLTLAQTEPDPNRYRQHILHVEPGGAFSVVALVWLPG